MSNTTELKKLDKSKIEIKIVSNYRDHPLSGLCTYDGKMCWFDCYNDRVDGSFRSEFKVYSLTNDEAYWLENNAKKFAIQMKYASWFYKDGCRMDEDECKKLAEEMEYDKSLDYDNRPKVIREDNLIGWYAIGVLDNTYHFDVEDLNTTKRANVTQPTEVAKNRYKDLVPLLELFEFKPTHENPKYIKFRVQADCYGGIDIEYFNHYDNKYIRISINDDGSVEFVRRDETKEWKEYCKDGNNKNPFRGHVFKTITALTFDVKDGVKEEDK